jgi:hypothetical protein
MPKLFGLKVNSKSICLASAFPALNPAAGAWRCQFYYPTWRALCGRGLPAYKVWARTRLRSQAHHVEQCIIRVTRREQNFEFGIDRLQPFGHHLAAHHRHDGIVVPLPQVWGGAVSQKT